jgi:predicted permease
VATKNAYRQLLGRLREIPGVQAADLTVLVPLSQQENIGPFWVGSQKPESSAKAPRALFYWTGPDYLQALKIPLLRGRYFTPADTTESDRVVVIDSVLARAYFAGQDPIGKTMTIPHWGDARIVGVVGHVRHWSLDDHAQYTENQIYAPFYELHDAWVPLFYITVIVRTPRDAASIVPDLKAAVFAGGSDQTIYGIQTIQGFISQSLSAQRFPMVVLAAFAALALLLASIGIYGVISYLVARRANEIGIRFALGARPLDVFRLVIGNGLRLALAGIAIGAVGSLILARVLPSFTYLLYGVRSRDPFTLISASVLLIIVAFLACFIPARRAMRTDPMTALRHE